MIEDVPFLFRLHKDNPFSDRLRRVDGFGNRDPASEIMSKFYTNSDFNAGYRPSSFFYRFPSTTRKPTKIVLREA